MKEFNSFDPNAGEVIPASKIQELISRTHEVKAKRGLKKKEYVHSQFFGREKLEELLHNTGSECVGLRINFVLEGENFDQLGAVIQAVDAKGNVLPIRKAHQNIGYRDGGDGGTGVYGGPKCPKTCLPPPETND